jgi:hypothetical protein
MPHDVQATAPPTLEHAPKKLPGFFGFDMRQIFDFELRPYQSNEPINGSWLVCIWRESPHYQEHDARTF